MTMILASVTVVGWWSDSDRGDCRRRRAVDISSCVSVIKSHRFFIEFKSHTGYQMDNELWGQTNEVSTRNRGNLRFSNICRSSLANITDVEMIQAVYMTVSLSILSNFVVHDDVIEWRHSQRYWPFVWENSPVTGEFPTQKPLTRSFDVFFDLRLNKRLNMQSWGWWFETSSRPLWRHRNEAINSFTDITCVAQVSEQANLRCARFDSIWRSCTYATEQSSED